MLKHNTLITKNKNVKNFTKLANYGEKFNIILITGKIVKSKKLYFTKLLKYKK